MKTQIKPSIGSSVKQPIKPSSVPSIKPQMKPIMKPSSVSSIKPQMKQVMRPSPVQSIKPQMKQVMRPSPVQSIKPQVKPSLGSSSIKPSIKKKPKKAYDPRLLSVIFIIGILSLVLLMTFLKALFVVLFFIMLNTIFRLYKRFMPSIPIEFELVMFSTLLCSMLYGIQAGVAVAILATLIAETANGTISLYNFVMSIGYIFVAVAGLFLTPENFAIAGFTICIVYNLIIWCIFHFFFRYDIIKNTIYAFSNLMFNYILFFYVSYGFIALLI